MFNFDVNVFQGKTTIDYSLMSAKSTLEHLKTTGIIATITSEIYNDNLLEVADALLASPILAVEIVRDSPVTAYAIQQFRERAGDNMLVGVYGAENPDQMAMFAEAGAQFASSQWDFMLPMIAKAKELDIVYLPTIHSASQSLMATHAGCPFQKIRDDIDIEHLEPIQARITETPYQSHLVFNQIPLEFVDAAFESDAAIVCINDLYTGKDQPMSELITRARQARDTYLI